MGLGRAAVVAAGREGEGARGGCGVGAAQPAVQIASRMSHAKPNKGQSAKQQLQPQCRGRGPSPNGPVPRA